ELAGHVVADHDAVVELVFLDVFANAVPAVVIHGNAQHRELLILEPALEIDEPGDLDLAGSAPRRPEIQQDDLAEIVGQMYGLTVGILEGEVGAGLLRRLVSTGRESHNENR